MLAPLAPLSQDDRWKSAVGVIISNHRISTYAIFTDIMVLNFDCDRIHCFVTGVNTVIYLYEL